MQKYDVNGNLIEGPMPAPPPVVDVIEQPKIEVRQLIKFLPIGILAGVFLSLSIVAAFTGSFFDKPKNPQSQQNAIILSSPSPQSHSPSTTRQSSPTITQSVTISPSITLTSTQTPVISYVPNPKWTVFTSTGGYSFTHPPEFTTQLGEQKTGTSLCQIIFGNNAGGILTASVVPYNGASSSLRDLLDNEQQGYSYDYEYAKIQDALSLIRQKGPAGESGSSSSVVIPKGVYALIITRSSVSKDSQEFIDLLEGIKFTGQLTSSNCGS